MSMGRWRKLRTKVPLGPFTVTFRDLTETDTVQGKKKKERVVNDPNVGLSMVIDELASGVSSGVPPMRPNKP